MTKQDNVNFLREKNSKRLHYRFLQQKENNTHKTHFIENQQRYSDDEKYLQINQQKIILINENVNGKT